MSAPRLHLQALPAPLAAMRERAREGRTYWAAYQNVALDSLNAGHLQFLLVGEGCTYNAPPEQYPADTSFGMGWRYRLVGTVELETGAVIDLAPAPAPAPRGTP